MLTLLSLWASNRRLLIEKKPMQLPSPLRSSNCRLLLLGRSWCSSDILQSVLEQTLSPPSCWEELTAIGDRASSEIHPHATTSKSSSIWSPFISVNCVYFLDYYFVDILDFVEFCGLFYNSNQKLDDYWPVTSRQISNSTVIDSQ